MPVPVGFTINNIEEEDNTENYAPNFTYIISYIITQNITLEDINNIFYENKLNITNQKYSTIKSDTHNECSICCDIYDDNDNVSILSCNHLFHTKCIENWGYKKNNCPICRTSIPIL